MKHYILKVDKANIHLLVIVGRFEENEYENALQFATDHGYYVLSMEYRGDKL